MIQVFDNGTATKLAFFADDYRRSGESEIVQSHRTVVERAEFLNAILAADLERGVADVPGRYVAQSMIWPRFFASQGVPFPGCSCGGSCGE